VILADNVVREGAVVNADNDGPAHKGIRRFYEMLATEQSVSATAIQTVGSKGYDGFAIALVIAERDRSSSHEGT
jgi:predicted O-methyltransferase YrrM